MDIGKILSNVPKQAAVLFLASLAGGNARETILDEYGRTSTEEARYSQAIAAGLVDRFQNGRSEGQRIGTKEGFVQFKEKNSAPDINRYLEQVVRNYENKMQRLREDGLGNRFPWEDDKKSQINFVTTAKVDGKEAQIVWNYQRAGWTPYVRNRQVGNYMSTGELSKLVDEGRSDVFPYALTTDSIRPDIGDREVQRFAVDLGKSITETTQTRAELSETLTPARGGTAILADLTDEDGALLNKDNADELLKLTQLLDQNPAQFNGTILNLSSGNPDFASSAGNYTFDGSSKQFKRPDGTFTPLSQLQTILGMAKNDGAQANIAALRLKLDKVPANEALITALGAGAPQPGAQPAGATAAAPAPALSPRGAFTKDLIDADGVKITADNADFAREFFRYLQASGLKTAKIDVTLMGIKDTLTFDAAKGGFVDGLGNVQPNDIILQQMSNPASGMTLRFPLESNPGFTTASMLADFQAGKQPITTGAPRVGAANAGLPTEAGETARNLSDIFGRRWGKKQDPEAGSAWSALHSNPATKPITDAVLGVINQYITNNRNNLGRYIGPDGKPTNDLGPDGAPYSLNPNNPFNNGQIAYAVASAMKANNIAAEELTAAMTTGGAPQASAPSPQKPKPTIGAGTAPAPAQTPVQSGPPAPMAQGTPVPLGSAANSVVFGWSQSPDGLDRLQILAGKLNASKLPAAKGAIDFFADIYNDYAANGRKNFGENAKKVDEYLTNNPGIERVVQSNLKMLDTHGPMQVPVYAGVKMTDKDGRVTFSLEQPTKLSGTSTGGRKTEENTSKPQPVVDPVNEKIAKILEENIYHAVNRSRDWLSPVKPINAINFSNFMNHIGSYSASLKTSLDTIKDGYHKAHAAGQFDNVVPGQRQAMRNDIIKELEKMPKEKRVQMINETREFGHLVFDLNQPPALPAPAPAGA